MLARTPGIWKTAPVMMTNPGMGTWKDHYRIQSETGTVATNIARKTDADVMAAAPELLAALEACLVELLRLSPTASEDAVIQANKAIIKATGGS